MVLKQLQPSPIYKVIVKPGLWTVDWTVDWIVDWTMDCDMDSTAHVCVSCSSLVVVAAVSAVCCLLILCLD